MSVTVFDNCPGLREQLRKEVIPIMPFLRAKQKLSKDEPMRLRLEAIDEGHKPNFNSWHTHWGTKAAVVVEKGIDGRFLFGSDEKEVNP